MNNTELFIKYLDNSLSDKEKLEFEKRLSTEKELKDEFDNFSREFNSLKKEVEIDERYFSTILPNARKRIEEKQKLSKVFNPIYKLSYFIPVILLAAFIFYRIFISVPTTDNQFGFNQIYSDLTSDSVSTQQILNETLHSNDYQYDQNSYSAVYNEDDYDKLLLKYVEANKHSIEINDSLFDQLSDNEFNLVYNKMVNKKIL